MAGTADVRFEPWVRLAPASRGEPSFGDGVNFNNARPKPGLPKFSPRQHVIEQYTHRAQFVRCICGWSGSSAADAGTASDWSRHVAEFRTVKR